MIIPVTQSNQMQAAIIHSESWKASHREICSAQFVALHTPERQKRYLASQIEKGAKLYMLIDHKAVGIVCVHNNQIENLYVLPGEQNKGYGTQLLEFAIKQCTAAPSLWVLSTNCGARRFYERHGFLPTGNTVEHAGGLYELEMRLARR
ncbi:GNAT family N-acetyltransferase [uncultured Ruthenibacterium sp.]|uniref:GNAT family N-acetyltransferase n=1 Tax=uncultured Ruthenibacterium sp. TaxID=1905347 RepID=UPI00349E5922